MSLILQASHEYYTAFFEEYQATESLKKSTAQQVKIAAPVKAYLNEMDSQSNQMAYGGYMTTTNNKAD